MAGSVPTAFRAENPPAASGLRRASHLPAASISSRRGEGRPLTVILCNKCGTKNEVTAEFCGGCGTFLEFTGVKIEDGPAASAAPSRPPPSRPAPPPAVEPAPVSPMAAAHPAPPAVRPGAPSAPAASTQPAERRPTDQLVRPARPFTPAPPAAPVLVAKPGDIICANCNTPNDRTRHFCRGCGRPLVAAAPVRKDPWWRRFFKKRQPVAAGTRTASQTRTTGGGGLGRTLRNGLVLAVIALAMFGVAGYVAVPSIRTSIDHGIKDVMRTFAQPTHVYPTGATGDAIGDHPPALAIDRTHNLFWAGPLTGRPPKLDFTFAAATDIVAVIVTPGAEDALTEFARPMELRFTFSDGTVLDATLRDASLVDPAPGQGTGKVLANQTFNTNAHDVTDVTVEVLSVYAGFRPAVAIAEIEFFTKP